MKNAYVYHSNESLKDFVLDMGRKYNIPTVDLTPALDALVSRIWVKGNLDL